MGNLKGRLRKPARHQNLDEIREKNKIRMREIRAKLREERNANLVQDTVMEENYGKKFIICIFNFYKLPIFSTFLNVARQVQYLFLILKVGSSCEF